MITITQRQLWMLLIHRYSPTYRFRFSQLKNIQGIVEHQGYLGKAGILDNRFRVMHFFSQAAHETDKFKTLREYHDGSNYEGRKDLGNTIDGDGRRFRGRGIFQLTGRYNYTQAAQRLGLPLLQNPELAETHEVSVQTAVDYWMRKKINDVADEDHVANVRAVTKRINGGYNGYDDRKAFFMAAGRVWKEDSSWWAGS